MRQNRAASAPFFYCVSYEILCETRIKPSFFGNCLISLFPALGQLRASRWPLALSVTAAASVGDGRSPLGCITRAGRRECHAKGMTERATRPRRARALVARTGAAFSRQSRLPARSVLNGPHWGPGPPRRELTAEALRRSGKALRCFPSFFSCAARL